MDNSFSITNFQILRVVLTKLIN